MTDAAETDRPVAKDHTPPGWFAATTSTFGDRLTGAREAAGLSEVELGKRLGVKTKTVRAWEDDRAEPRANRLQMVAGVLGVSIMWLLNGEGDGLEGPELAEEAPEDMVEVLRDLRMLKVEQARLAEVAARLEKRLRLALADRSS